MCYSALVTQDLGKLARKYGAKVALAVFVDLFQRRLEDPSIRIPRAMEDNFTLSSDPAHAAIAELILEHRRRRTQEWETELFAQKKRLADAERKLQVKETKAALEHRRIATKRIEWLLDKLSDLKSAARGEDDSRIFPLHYAPVITSDNGERWIRPMRYHLRPAGKPALYDKKFDGLYNARSDNLEGFWKSQFGSTHGLVEITGFFENVALHDFERRALAEGEKEQNVVLQFRPQAGTEMQVACLWSHWRGRGAPDLLSFAAITDEPPAEIAAAGHDRCVVPLKDAHVEAWLNPAGHDAQSLRALLVDRERYYYEHRLAA